MQEEFNELDEEIQSESLEESPHKLAMLEERRKMKIRFVAIGLIVFLAIFYFIWRNFINFGTLEIHGEIPYDITVFEEKLITCSEDPCTVKLKRGEKTIIFYKTGYAAESIEVEVPLWGKTSIAPRFVMNPYMEEIEKLTEEKQSQTYPKYKIKYDAKHNNWKVIKEGDNEEFAIAYFVEKIESPLIFGSDKAILIVEQDPLANQNPVYFIDITTKQRNTIGLTDQKILSATPSINGRYFLLETESEEGNNSASIADKNLIWQPEIQLNIKNTSWTPENKLALAYREEDNWVFTLYDPQEREQRTLMTTDRFTTLTLDDESGETITQSPPIENFFSSTNSNKLYFQVGGNNWQIVY